MKIRNNSWGPSSAPASWYFQMTYLDYFWYFNTVIAMIMALLMNSSILRLYTIFFLFIILLELWVVRIILKNTQSHSESFLTFLCPFSINCLINTEIVWTDLALTSDELVSHQSKRSLMKQLPRHSSGTLLLKISRQMPSIAKIFVSGSPEMAKFCIFLRYRSYSKG